MKKGLFLAAALGLFAVGQAVAQQDAQLTHYMFNTMYYNPAYVGLDGGARFSGLAREQYLGYRGADNGGNPRTQLFTFNAPLLKYSSGVGFQIVHDQLGAQNNLEAQLSYAYHLTVGQGKLSLGARAGVISRGIDWDIYRPNDPNDPLLGRGSETEYGPDFSAGVFYKTERYHVGLGVNHLYQHRFDFGRPDLQNSYQQHYNLNAGYIFDLNYAWTLNTNLLARSVNFNSATTTVDVSAIANYGNKFFGGLNYRLQDAVSAIVGIGVLKDNSLRISYAVDLHVPTTEAKRFTSHELMLAYTLPVELRGSKPIIRTPRYRK